MKVGFYFKIKLFSIFLSLFFLSYSFCAIAQDVTLKELQIICSSKNFETTNKILLLKNYEFSKTEKTAENIDVISWTFDPVVVGKPKNTATLTIFSLSGAINKAVFKFRAKSIYAAILNEITKQAFVSENEEIVDGLFVSNYSNANYYLKLSFKKETDELAVDPITYTAYEVQISKKGGIDDVNNGLKTEFYEDGKPKVEYTLKDGKPHGPIHYFNPDGKIAKSGAISFGVEMGVFTEFLYDNSSGVLKQKESGEIVEGKKNGKWLTNAIHDGKESNLTFTHFVSGVKEGSFSTVQNDSICFGNYKNDLLEGKYSVYTTANNFELGAIVETDTLKLKRVLLGFYSNNKKEGLWKTFDIDGTLTIVGNYENDKKIGKWSHYYCIYVDDNDKEMDYSGQLFLEENFKDGKRHGETKRFSVLRQVEFPCTNDSKKKCLKIEYSKINEITNYENGLRNGSYLLTNEKNEIVEKGQYLEGMKTGKWLLTNDSKIVLANKKSIETGDYINDKKQGKWERLISDKIVETYFYKDNLLDGDHVYLTDGKQKERRKFQNEKLSMLELLDSAEKTTTKYVITHNADNYNCEKTEFLANQIAIKTFLVKRDSIKLFDCATFKEDFESAPKIADGICKKKTLDEKLLEEGSFKNNLKSGKWTALYYDQKVKTEFDYKEDGSIANERYFDLKKNEPYSGEFEFKYEDGSGSEERKIKDGIRNGTTRYKDAKDKTIKKETYKDGILKEKE